MTDASRFDQHVSVAALEWEHSLYKSWYRSCSADERAELGSLLNKQIVNKGYGRCKDGTYIKYVRRGGRMSGDMNTALGNCLIMSGLMFGLQQATGVSFEVADDGDDCVIICERGDAERLQSAIPDHFLSAGFTMEVSATVGRFEEIEFCQCHPVLTPVGPLMVRNPVKVLGTDMAGRKLWHVKPQEMLALVGYGGGHLSPGIPVLQAFYKALRTHKPDAKFMDADTGFMRMVQLTLASTKRSLDRVPEAPIDDATRVSFWHAFGIPPDQQVAIEEKLAAMAIPLSEPETFIHGVEEWRRRCIDWW
jgi:hypothetical protein